MKARPCVIVPGEGYVECAPEKATHLTIRMPGPTGTLTLPVQIRGSRAGTGNWTWNGSVVAPDLKPSILTTCGSWRCHSWLNDGKVQFLSDCSHDLAGQTVDLLDLEGL